jgi:hypothetical protein
MLNFLFISVLCFPQQNIPVVVQGAIPGTDDPSLHEIQVGAFSQAQNAANAFNILSKGGFSPIFENIPQRNLTRVLVRGIPAGEVRGNLERIGRLGFREVIIRRDTRNFANLTEDIHNLIPDKYLEAIRDLGIEINGGRNPPNIEGTYFVDPLLLVENTTGGSIAAQWDKKVTFSRQDNTTLTINADYTMQTENFTDPMSSSGPGSYIVGEGNKFTVVVDGTREQGGFTAKTVEIFSGEISALGILNYHWAVMMIDNSGNPLNIWIANGTGYAKKDGDGLSERVF